MPPRAEAFDVRVGAAVIVVVAPGLPRVCPSAPALSRLPMRRTERPLSFALLTPVKGAAKVRSPPDLHVLARQTGHQACGRFGMTAAIRRVSHQWLIRGGGKSNGELRRRFCHLGVYPLAVLQRCLVWLTHRLWGRTGAYFFATSL
jgi:hypothetical protein